MWAMLQAPLMATPLSKKAKVSPEESRPLAAGTRVVLRGLKGSSEHNGTYALVRSYDESRSRYCVALEAGKGSEVSRSTRPRPNSMRPSSPSVGATL